MPAGGIRHRPLPLRRATNPSASRLMISARAPGRYAAHPRRGGPARPELRVQKNHPEGPLQPPCCHSPAIPYSTPKRGIMAANGDGLCSRCSTLTTLPASRLPQPPPALATLRPRVLIRRLPHGALPRSVTGEWRRRPLRQPPRPVTPWPSSAWVSTCARVPGSGRESGRHPAPLQGLLSQEEFQWKKAELLQRV